MATGERSPQGEGGTNYEPFELQPSVLEAVASLCPDHEAEEIWRIVGPSLVEQARDLLDEARIHLEIWRDLNEVADNAASCGLPEPPLVRERLIQEIRFLTNHLQARSRSSTVESCTDDRNREILDYALTTPDLHSGGRGSRCGRPPSAISSRDGRDTPLRRATPTSQDGSSSSSLLSGGSGLSVEHVSLAAIDSTVQYLRESLEEEITQRRQDIAFLQDACEGERVFLQSSSQPPPPSLRELREVGTLLEREVMSGTNRGSPPRTTSPPPGRLMQPRPPPMKHSTASSAGIRRASGVKPRPIQSSPDPVISRRNTTETVSHRSSCRQSGSEVFSPAPRYTGITAAAPPHTQPIT